eukprot:snap_masked-scaffold_4-processed-gene-18.26-mRNA-1 protein AED:0.13 eAED:0.16 QI:0/-1/0/1/-1/1/1/0/221
MGKYKKGGEDTRGLKAKAQKKDAAAVKKGAEDARKEALSKKDWAVGANSRQAAKDAEAERKAEEKELKRLQKKALMEQEEGELGRMKAKPGKARKAQLKGKKKKNDTSALDAYLKEEKKEKAAKEKKRNKVSEMQTLSENRNKTNDGLSARNVDDAIGLLDQLTIKQEKNPKFKQVYGEFEAKKIIEIREANPGLKMNQIKERVWKEWKKSPENPFRNMPQ